MTVIIWAIGAILVLIGELWAVFNKRSGDTITEHTKRRWWTRGAMGALLAWAAWHFGTDEGGWIDLVPLAVGFAGGVMAHRLKLQRTTEGS